MSARTSKTSGAPAQREQFSMLFRLVFETSGLGAGCPSANDADLDVNGDGGR